MTEHQRSTPLTSAELLMNSRLPPPTSAILPHTSLQESIIIHNHHLVLGRAKQLHPNFLSPLLLSLSWSRVHTHKHRPVASKKHVLLMCYGTLSPRIPQIPQRSPPMRININRGLPFLRRRSRDVQQQPLCFCRNIGTAVDVKLSSPPGRIIVDHVVL